MSGNSIITLNSSNVSSTQTNVYNFNFPSGSVNFKKSKIAIQSCIIPYSWLNFNTVYLNTTFTLTFPNRVGGVDGTANINVSVPNGFYTISELNSYIQSLMITAGYYLINASSQNVFYIEIVGNTQLNNAQLNCYVVPTALPTGYSYGATSTWGAAGSSSFNTTANLVPQLTTLANNFGELIGFIASTSFPSSNISAVTISTASSVVPQITPVQSIYVGCSLVRNKYANPTNLIGNIALTSAYATNIIYSPNEFSWLPILDGNYPSFQIIFYDQLFRNLPVIDENLTINLLIQDADIDLNKN